MKQLWTEKYRPNDIDGYVFRDQEQKNQVKVLEPITCISLSSSEGSGNLMMSFEWESDGH